jgi:hypothetical protein
MYRQQMEEEAGLAASCSSLRKLHELLGSVVARFINSGHSSSSPRAVFRAKIKLQIGTQPPRKLR